jgi:hypothetical protein
MHIERTTNAVRVSWPTNNGGNFLLESTPSLGGAWHTRTNTLVSSGRYHFVTPPSNAATFFRLVRTNVAASSLAASMGLNVAFKETSDCTDCISGGAMKNLTPTNNPVNHELKIDVGRFSESWRFSAEKQSLRMIDLGFTEWDGHKFL